MQEFKIVEKVFTLTLDNAYENSIAARDLRSLLKLNCDGKKKFMEDVYVTS